MGSIARDAGAVPGARQAARSIPPTIGVVTRRTSPSSESSVLVGASPSCVRPPDLECSRTHVKRHNDDYSGKGGDL